MAFTQITNILNTEQSRLESIRDDVVNPPTNFQSYSLKKSLSQLTRMRQQSGETDADYALRINLECQAAPAGYWSVSFFTQLDAAVASDTSEGSRGGRGRTD